MKTELGEVDDEFHRSRNPDKKLMGLSNGRIIEPESKP